MAKRQDQLDRRSRILSDFAASWPVSLIAMREGCSQSNVSRIVREYGEPVYPDRTEHGVEMKRAEFYQEAICEAYNAGQSIDQIAKSYGIHAREVRAGVYLGIQQGRVSAFLPGIEPSQEDDETATVDQPLTR